MDCSNARPPCPSPTPRVHPDSRPLSWWCHPAISSFGVPFSRPQSFPASGSFQMSQFFASGGRSNGVSASASVLPMNTQDWSPLGWTGWISLQSKGLSRVSPTPQVKGINSWALSFLHSPTLTSTHNYWKNHSLDQTDLCWQSKVSAFNMAGVLSNHKWETLPYAALRMELQSAVLSEGQWPHDLTVKQGEQSCAAQAHSGEESSRQCRRHGDAGLIPEWWDPVEKRMAAPVFLPGKFHGQRRLTGYIQSMESQTGRHNRARTLMYILRII